MDSPRLTSLAHGGRCGCKLAPAVLQQLLAGSPAAAVYRLRPDLAVVATDFFTPVVDDPFDFESIAATKALSDVHAMGGTPFMALALLGMPVTTLPVDVVAQILAALPGVHACTDVTGFGLLGHAGEMVRGSALAITLDADAIPLLPAAAALVQQGIITGAGLRNWASYDGTVDLPAGFPNWHRALLCGPQTSGGLLIAADDATVAAVLDRYAAAGFAPAIIGRLDAGPPGTTVC